MEHAIKKERRHAVYVSTPPVPPPKDDEVAFEVHSPLESLLTLVDDQEEPTVRGVRSTCASPSPHRAMQSGFRSRMADRRPSACSPPSRRLTPTGR